MIRSLVCAALLTLVLTLVVSGCQNAPPSEAPQGIRSQSTASAIIREMSYFKDVRTGLCFAGIRSGGTYGTSYAIAVVPCASVPPNMLVVPPKQ